MGKLMNELKRQAKENLECEPKLAEMNLGFVEFHAQMKDHIKKLNNDNRMRLCGTFQSNDLDTVCCLSYEDFSNLNIESDTINIVENIPNNPLESCNSCYYILREKTDNNIHRLVCETVTSDGVKKCHEIEFSPPMQNTSNKMFHAHLPLKDARNLDRSIAVCIDKFGRIIQL